MVTAAWIAATATALCWVLLLRLTIRVFGRGADNGWDNALAYAVATVVLFFPARWMIGSRSLLLISLAPALVWAGQIVALKVIYEVKALRALMIGATHTVVTSAVVSTLALATGVVVAYVMYGKIISDPMILIRILLRLIGLWPHEVVV